MATQEIAIRESGAVSRYDDPEMVNTIKHTVAKGATDAQLRMFLEVCKRTGLDPFLKEIWFVAEKGIIMAGRDGYLRVANENPMFDGIETRVERDEKNVPIKAVCTVWRKDRTHPTICEAYFSEYRSGSPVWTKYPSAMISKVSEVLALKRSFAINGVVSEEEMAASDPDPRGSKEAAQRVAEEKLAAHKAGLPAPVIEAEFVEPEPHPDPEMAMHLEILFALQNSQRKVTFDKFKMLPEMAKLKTRFLKLEGGESAYYRVLNRCGAQKSNEFTDDNGGLMARVAYKELSLILEQMETAKLQGALADSMPPEVDRLPDAVEQVAGTTLRRAGALWVVIESDGVHQWEMVKQ